MTVNSRVLLKMFGVRIKFLVEATNSFPWYKYLLEICSQHKRWLRGLYY